MTDDRLRLTRRKILASIGGVGITGAGAGMGTSALFSDEEEFESNSFTAGKLNLLVTGDIRGKSDDLPYPDISPEGPGADDTADGDTVTIWISDMKPGDWFIIEWNLEVTHNPGYVQVTSVDSDYQNNEGTNTEAETDTTSPGDLGDALLSTVWLTLSNTSRQDLEDLDPTTDRNDTGLTSYETPNQDGVTSSSAHYTTANEAHDVYKNGILVRDPSGNPLRIGSAATTTPVPDASFYQLFELPEAVGNDVQGDELVFTLRFEAEQARNNPNPFQ